MTHARTQGNPVLHGVARALTEPAAQPAPAHLPDPTREGATRDPAQTGYCFFVATGEGGRHIFAQNYGEQQQNLQIYGYNP